MRTLFLAVLLMPLALLGQDKDTILDGYHRRAMYSASGAFTDLNNWNAGGENSSNVSLLLRENWIQKGPNLTTVHLLEGNYGISRQAGAFTKNADKLEFTTTVTASPKITEWNISGQFNVRTQFAPGFAEGDTSGTPISNFGAPIYGQFSLGIGNNYSDNFQVFLSPLAGKSTAVLDEVLRDKGAFGLDTGATWRFETGAKATLNFAKEFSDEFSVAAKTDVFYNYAGSLNEVDLSLDIIALYKIKEAFSISGHVQLLRDIDQIDAWQRRSVLGVGLAYTIK